MLGIEMRWRMEMVGMEMVGMEMVGMEMVEDGDGRDENGKRG